MLTHLQGLEMKLVLLILICQKGRYLGGGKYLGGYVFYNLYKKLKNSPKWKSPECQQAISILEAARATDIDVSVQIHLIVFRYDIVKLNEVYIICYGEPAVRGEQTFENRIFIIKDIIFIIKDIILKFRRVENCGITIQLMTKSWFRV